MKKRILIAGGTGLIGTRLISMIDKSRYDIHILSRSKKENRDNIKYFVWDINKMHIEEGAVDVDYIINFTGAGIADKRWTDDRKKVLIDSRVNSILLLAKGLEQSKNRPQAIINASAIGFYGSRGEEILTEESTAGEGFLPECCIKWENATSSLSPLCDRLIINRIGIVLSHKGGALPKILMTKSIGIYNYFGNGKQYYSWIHIDDVCRMFLYGIENKNMEGTYNAVSPTPLKNKKFTQKIKKSIGGIAVLPAPKFGLKMALGEMAHVVLDSARVVPQRYIDGNFEFEYPILEEAILDIIKRKV